MSVPLPHCGRGYYVRVDHDIAIAANDVVVVFVVVVVAVVVVVVVVVVFPAFRSDHPHCNQCVDYNCVVQSFCC